MSEHERFYAQGRTGGARRVLLVLQGMDTSGKGGAVKHVARQTALVGLSVTAFGPPTPQEREHGFLWRVEQRVPAAGQIGVFDRSHYEDVLVARVHDLVPPEEWEARYDQINAWEATLVERDVRLLKVMLHISPEEQRERLLARLDDPTKHWKVDPGDLEERAAWPAHQTAYEVALERCSTPVGALARRARGPQVVPQLGSVELARGGGAPPRPAVAPTRAGPGRDESGAARVLMRDRGKGAIIVRPRVPEETL